MMPDRFAPYAADPARSRGRRHGADPSRGHVRDAFQRDRDRIIHSIAFRRLNGKTQVFVAPDGDHFRVRLTHSLEVAQIGRTIARGLRLNEDLTEAICLAHDIGHPPFGHAGEDALKAATLAAGGFDHNGHTLRVLTALESPYPSFAGLDLSWETLEGLAKHNGPVRRPGWALATADADFPLDLGSRASLEAQVAAIADDIAYDNHDIDDGLRAGLIDRDALLAVPIVAESARIVATRFPGLGPDALAREVVRTGIGRMVEDVLAESRRRITEAGITSADDIRAWPHALVGFSPAMATAERGLKRVLYAELYHHPQLLTLSRATQDVVTGLMSAYAADPDLLPPAWRAGLPADEPWRTRHLADFVAGMTDRFAIACYRSTVGPIDLPEGF